MRRQIVMLLGATALTFVAAFGLAAFLSGSGESRGERALEAAGIEENEPGGEGGPVALDPNGRKTVSEPRGLTGKRGEFDGDVRSLDGKKPRDRGERPERGQLDPGIAASAKDAAAQAAAVSASAPSPSTVFPGLDYNTAGNGYPPDTNGDVGPNHFVQSVNTSIGIFSKTGTKLASFPFDGFIQGTGTLCDTDNYGDPVVLYDTFSDRWIISDFAFTTNAAGDVNSDNYECFAVSKTGDPVAGGWRFYAFKVASGGDIADYPKFGVWPDGIYMSANVFGPLTFKNVQVWAFNRADLEGGVAAPRAVTFSLPQTVGGVDVFSLLPSNARVQAGTPPAGRPNLFASIWGSYQIRVWKFTPDWANLPSSTFTGPANSTVATFSVGPSTVPSPAKALDTLTYRLMMQNQYANSGGAESLWLTHTVGSSSIARVRWYELPVTGGTVASTPAQQSTWGADSTHRFMPSLAVDRLGDMAVGYSVSSSSLSPGIRYAGRLVSDPASTLGQAETTMAAGGGSQTYTSRWGDYATMTLDPDGCTFWFTSEIYAVTGSNWNTRIGSFRYPSCSGSATVPVAPSGLSVTRAAATNVSLGWTDNSTDETAFAIERSPDSTSWAQIGTVGANATSYTDLTVAASTAYSYRVRATNGAGSSGFSNVVTVTTPAAPAAPAAPTGLIATAVSRTQINLTWVDASGNETGFKVERSTNGTTFSQIGAVGANVKSYSSTGLSKGKTYWYRVRATNASGDSAYSNTASAKTPRN